MIDTHSVPTIERYTSYFEPLPIDQSIGTISINKMSPISIPTRSVFSTAQTGSLQSDHPAIWRFPSFLSPPWLPASQQQQLTSLLKLILLWLETVVLPTHAKVLDGARICAMTGYVASRRTRFHDHRHWNIIVQEMPRRQWILQERRMLWYGAVVSSSRRTWPTRLLTKMNSTCCCYYDWSASIANPQTWRRRIYSSANFSSASQDIMRAACSHCYWTYSCQALVWLIAWYQIPWCFGPKFPNIFSCSKSRD